MRSSSTALYLQPEHTMFSQWAAARHWRHVLAVPNSPSQIHASEMYRSPTSMTRPHSSHLCGFFARGVPSLTSST
jgi:hypothetical protein